MSISVGARGGSTFGAGGRGGGGGGGGGGATTTGGGGAGGACCTTGGFFFPQANVPVMTPATLRSKSAGTIRRSMDTLQKLGGKCCASRKSRRAYPADVRAVNEMRPRNDLDQKFAGQL